MEIVERQAALRLHTYGMYVIGSGEGEEVNGMTLNWITQISFDPCLLAIAVKQGAQTRELIDRFGHFTVNTIGDGEAGIALLKLFVKPQRRVGSKLGDGVPFREASLGAPILEAALAFAECKVVSTQADHGDHVLYIGEVVDARVQHEGTPIRMTDAGWKYAG